MSNIATAEVGTLVAPATLLRPSIAPSERSHAPNVVRRSHRALLASATSAAAQTLQAGFQQGAVFTGLTQPTAVKFASDGRVFVAEKSGLIKVFDNLADTTPTVFADLRTNVHNFWDRGLLGLELHPNFPSTPYVYVLYALDAPIGGTAPRWGVAGMTTDPCPSPPGATADGCVVGARLSRLTASGNVATGPETVFLEDWCQQYPSHSIGTIAFGSDGALYVTGGDGASFNFVDYGQDGVPLNPCGDPPTGVAGAQTPPSAEGGALRSQDLERVSDPTGFARDCAPPGSADRSGRFLTIPCTAALRPTTTASSHTGCATRSG